jgi:hypothetical protein
MKKFFFLLLLLPFLSCENFAGKTSEEKQLDQRKIKIQAAFDSTLSYQLAWTNAQLNLNYWIAHRTESQEKLALSRFVSVDYQKMKPVIDSISDLVGDPDVKHVLKNMDKQAQIMREIMESLNSFDDYENPEVLFLVQSRFDDLDGDALIGYRAIMNSLDILKSRLKTELLTKIKR